MNPDAARATAQWWTDRLVLEDSGIRQVPAPDDMQRAVFREELSALLLYSTRERMVLDIGGSPCIILSRALKRAGIDALRLPRRAVTLLSPAYVTASAGPGPRVRLIWTSPDWERPSCAAQARSRGEEYGQYDPECRLPVWHEGDHGRS